MLIILLSGCSEYKDKEVGVVDSNNENVETSFTPIENDRKYNSLSESGIKDLSPNEFSEFLDEVVNISYGIQDKDSFRKILNLYDQGDMRAQFSIALYLLDYDLNSNLSESDKIENSGYNLMFDLYKKNYIPANVFLSRFDNDVIFENLKIEKKDIRKLRLKMVDEAISYVDKIENTSVNELDVLNFDWNIIYLLRADLTLFEDTVDNEQYLIKNLDFKDKKIDFRKVLSDYEICYNKTKDTYCASRVSEIYYLGLKGVKKNLEKSKEWQKLTK